MCVLTIVASSLGHLSNLIHDASLKRSRKDRQTKSTNSGTLVREYRGGWIGAELHSNNPELGERSANRHVLTLAPDSDTPIKINFDGTFKAMAATRECNKL